MQVMCDNQIRLQIIIHDQKVMGLISIDDVVRELIAYQNSVIEQFQSYIAGHKFS